MKRLAKILAILVGVIIVLIIVAAIVLPLVFDPNDYKAEITGMIEDRIGREVAIPGEIELSVFPWLGISIGRVTVANAPGFGDKPLAAIDSAEVHVKLLPLLQQHIEIGTVSLEGLRLRLARNASGQTNWAGIVEHLSSSQQTTPKQTQPEPASSAGGFQLKSLEIGAIEVSDAAVTWNDAMTGNSYKLSDFYLSTGHLAEDQAFTLEMGAALAAATQGVTSTFNLTTRIHPNISAGIYKFSDLQLQIEAEGPAVPGGSQQVSVSAHGSYNLGAGTFALKDLLVEAAGLQISGQLNGKGLNATPAFSGRVAVAQFDPRAVLEGLGMSVPQLQGEDVLTNASVEAQFSATSSSAELSQLRITLDDSTFTGSARVSDFSAPAITFNASVDKFNLDHYLPVASAQETQPEKNNDKNKKKQDGSSGTSTIDLSMLEDLVLDGKLHVGRLTAYDMTFNDATLAISAADGVLIIKPLVSGFYEGKIHVIARVDASGKVPQYSLEASLAKLQFAPLLKDLVGTDVVSALASLKLDLSSAGASVAAIKQALDGTFQFELQDGAFHGFNLASLIAMARSQFLGDGSTQAAGGSQTTPFNKFAGQFSIHNGTISGDGMTLDTRYLNVAGGGQYNLVANNLDYTLTVHVDEDGGPLAEVAGLSVPIHLGGSLFAPDYSIDIAVALKGLAQQHLQEEKQELKNKIQQEVSEELKGLDGQLGEQLNNKLQQGLSDLFN